MASGVVRGLTGTRRRRPLAILFGSVAAVAAGAALAQAPRSSAGQDALAAGFRDPPNSARPRVWWHWMNGNVTKDGIQKDMEWMSRVGIGGLQNFDAALTTPQVVEKRLAYMTPEWKDAFRFSASLAERLGLELAIAASPGWSETGGPWVPAQDGIKKLVWSETVVAGGRPFPGVLAPPPAEVGPFADMLRAATIASGAGRIAEHYEDVAVLAIPAGDPPSLPQPRVTNAGTPVDVALLTDGRYGRSVDLRRDRIGGEASALIEYPSPQTIRSATVALKPAGRSIFSPTDVLPVLEAEASPGQWRKVV
ncbi:MAG TPA: glycosyl hydrolase, partial [Phenylobacterium sp.]|nr:glycosyl hydrolase [Phenylobacterium sp.]